MRMVMATMKKKASFSVDHVFHKVGVLVLKKGGLSLALCQAHLPPVLCQAHLPPLFIYQAHLWPVLPYQTLILSIVNLALQLHLYPLLPPLLKLHLSHGLAHHQFLNFLFILILRKTKPSSATKQCACILTSTESLKFL